MSRKLYRVAWKVIASGATGHGDFCLTLPQAETWIYSLTHGYPDMIHWIEEEDGDIFMALVG